ncbi:MULTISPECIES: hypothetical protein [unclassified Psychrobacter]|uniref:hypothetical protein n=1 Tax=unclassified Psychrobacter TaxID=196806 RepID=UPI003FD532A1
MNNRQRAGILTAIIGLIALIALLNASTSASIINWPMEAYLGTVFTIGWLSGVPDWLAYILAIVVFIVVIGIGYKLGSWLYGLVRG